MGNALQSPWGERKGVANVGKTHFLMLFLPHTPTQYPPAAQIVSLHTVSPVRPHTHFTVPLTPHYHLSCDIHQAYRVHAYVHMIPTHAVILCQWTCKACRPLKWLLTPYRPTSNKPIERGKEAFYWKDISIPRHLFLFAWICHEIQFSTSFPNLHKPGQIANSVEPARFQGNDFLKCSMINCTY